MAMTSGLLAHGELDFALPQAVNLAEAGSTTSYKRIGTFFVISSIQDLHFKVFKVIYFVLKLCLGVMSCS
jgi:hypothetical protein